MTKFGPEAKDRINDLKELNVDIVESIDGKVYEVKKGDTLWDIIKKQFGITDDTDIANKIIKISKSNMMNDTIKEDSLSVVDGELLQQPDGIPGDLIVPGEKIIIKIINKGLNYTVKTKIQQKENKEKNNIEKYLSDYLYEPKITNEYVTTLHGQELNQVRYDQLSKGLRNNPNTNKTKITFQWKPTLEEGFDEKEDIMTAEMTLLKNGDLQIKSEKWQASISKDGEISGNMPKKLIIFLTYNKIERDLESNGETSHKIDYFKKGFGSGHAIIESPIYD